MISTARVLAISSLLCLPALLSGCATPSINTQSDYDASFEFADVKRLRILPIDRTTAAEKLISDMQVRRIEEALATELVSRGYEVVGDSHSADLNVSWHLVTREKTDIRSYNAYIAYNCWRCGPPVSDVSVRQFTEGTFIVDLIDPSRNQSVWRTTIQSQLRSAPDPSQSAEVRAKAAKAVFAPFPPSAADSE